MDTVETIRARQSERGITTAELARRTNIDYEALRNSLKKERNITADELIALCTVLEMAIGDFELKM